MKTMNIKDGEQQVISEPSVDPEEPGFNVTKLRDVLNEMYGMVEGYWKDGIITFDQFHEFWEQYDKGTVELAKLFPIIDEE